MVCLSVAFLASIATAVAQTVLVPPTKEQVEWISPKGRWPEFEQGQQRRVHVWYDENQVWHFRCTARNPITFDGTVTLDKGRLQIVGGDAAREQRGKEGKVTNPGKADYVRLTPRGVAFRFNARGTLDGLDFVVPKEAKTVRFEFVVNGERKAEYIFVGSEGAHPSAPAFVLPAHPDRP
jgi:hypothetical protein